MENQNMSDDIGSMPIRELISSLRKQTSELPPSDMLRILFVNALTNRLEQEADRADKAEGRLAELEELGVEPE